MNRNVWSILVITVTILLLVTATASAALDMQEESSPGYTAVLVHALKAGSVDAALPAVDVEEEANYFLSLPGPAESPEEDTDE